ncbi:hypothetical protein AA0119_g11418 [Alternaria tenuissima]|uniref:Uncharacterized protein n=1 Tax=Alternaria tenuissima TaxID=119927 RepID=A0A4Q4P464_9PLEO|nr:hypothetical protein AA0115_g4706 [Alternaria tenuissima]RYN89352.1 hypothetical protein AA0119_g11418 [Alternaria tenuissima]RYO19694.1 hypothetical protein AA0121_g4117 [Alternaria tenuissima]RYO60685.1 hypothetical protein AA0116_g6269 [Alternaria tenuissima]
MYKPALQLTCWAPIRHSPILLYSARAPLNTPLTSTAGLDVRYHALRSEHRQDDARTLARIPNGLRDDVPSAAAHPRSVSVLPTLRKCLQHSHVRIAPRHHHRDAQADQL